MQTFVNILLTLLIFIVIILIHEFGHFITAKLCGVKVNEFAIGMGPTLFRKKGKETTYSVRGVPHRRLCQHGGGGKPFRRRTGI